MGTKATNDAKVILLRLKSHIRGSLERLGLYERIRTSWIYDFYWSLADRRIIDDRRSELDFYRALLDGFRDGDLIFDVGANHGYKSNIFLTLGAKVVALEPDGISQEILKQKFLTNRLKKKPLVIVGKAVSDNSSTITMWVDAPGSAMNTLSQKWAETLRADEGRFGHRLSFKHRKEVETISMEQLIAKYGSPFFVKIDVEGHEVSVLRGMQRSVPYLSFEVNLPEFRTEALECVRVLQRLDRDGSFNYTPDCRRGLVLKRWHRAVEFEAILDSCIDASIEVFWKTPIRRQVGG